MVVIDIDLIYLILLLFNFRVVELIDTGLFFDAPNNYGRTKLSNDPITNAAIDGLGYSTTDQLDLRYEPIASSTNQLVTQRYFRCGCNAVS